MATISASPEVVGPSLRTWLRPPKPSAVEVGLELRPAAGSVGEADVVPDEIPWRLLSAIAAVFLLTLLSSGLLARLAASAVAVHVPASMASVPETRAYPAWSVDAGDTLWSIAVAVAPDEDPRNTVTRIRALNGLPADHVLQVGEILQVPQRS